MISNYEKNHSGEPPFPHVIIRGIKETPHLYLSGNLRIVQDNWEDSSITRYDNQSWSVSHLLRELDYAKQEDWDSEGAAAVEPESFSAARDILLDLKNIGLPEPDIQPSADGALCMEWIWNTSKKIFLDIGPHTRICAFAKSKTSSQEKHFDKYDRQAKGFIFRLFDQVTEHLDT